jgi:hypothetical protein
MRLAALMPSSCGVVVVDLHSPVAECVDTTGPCLSNAVAALRASALFQAGMLARAWCQLRCYSL